MGRREVGERWGTLQRLPHDFQNSVEIIEHVVVPEADDAVAMFCQFCGPGGVGSLLDGMLPAIELDRECSRRAGEIDDVAADRMLAAEFPFRHSLAQCTPEHSLDVGAVASQLACC